MTNAQADTMRIAAKPDNGGFTDATGNRWELALEYVEWSGPKAVQRDGQVGNYYEGFIWLAKDGDTDSTESIVCRDGKWLPNA